jgi:hypothetical protein
VTQESEFLWIVFNAIEAKIVFVIFWHDIGIFLSDVLKIASGSEGQTHGKSR